MRKPYWRKVGEDETMEQWSDDGSCYVEVPKGVVEQVKLNTIKKYEKEKNKN